MIIESEYGMLAVTRTSENNKLKQTDLPIFRKKKKSVTRRRFWHPFCRTGVAGLCQPMASGTHFLKHKGMTNITLTDIPSFIKGILPLSLANSGTVLPP